MNIFNNKYDRFTIEELKTLKENIKDIQTKYDIKKDNGYNCIPRYSPLFNLPEGSICDMNNGKYINYTPGFFIWLIKENKLHNDIHLLEIFRKEHYKLKQKYKKNSNYTISSPILYTKAYIKYFSFASFDFLYENYDKYSNGKKKPLDKDMKRFIAKYNMFVR